MLIPKWNAYNSNVKQHSKKEMGQANDKAPKDDPQNIHDNRQAAATSLVNHFASERPERQ